jgi:hypothetical protein
MKTLLLIIFYFAAFNAFAQTSEAVTEEKSSAWLKVVEDPVPVSKPATPKKKQSTVRKKTTSTPAPQKQETQDEFEKTNSQVNRFKKKG